MKSRESIEKQIFAISEDDRKTIISLSEEIKMATETRVVNEELIHKLDNIITTLDNLRDSYLWRLLRAAKQNHMIDKLPTSGGNFISGFSIFRRSAQFSISRRVH